MPATTPHVAIDDVRAFWDSNPCGHQLSQEDERRAYFAELERKRYALEWHIPVVARFGEHRDRDVLEIGCGMGSDAIQFGRAGARYTGVDLTPAGIETTRERFALEGIEGRFVVSNAERLPFDDASFDHVYSFGVIHHSPDTEAIVREMARVLRPGGTATVMIYNRSSINYYVEIMFLRRVFRQLLRPGFMPAMLAALTGFDRWKLEGHRQAMLERPHMTKAEWISMNTDGPHCPLAKVYGRRDALELFAPFDEVRTEAWHFDHTHWPVVGRLMPAALRRWLGRRWGWHRMVFARKAA